METTFWSGANDIGLDQFFRPVALCVVEGNSGNPWPARVLERYTQANDILLAMMPPWHKPMMRLLVVNERLDPSDCFLETSARLCGALAVEPLVLTLAGSERDALAKQRFAEGVYASLRVCGDFDSVVADDSRLAIARVAAWRGCSHVVCERATAMPEGGRRQRWRDDEFRDFRKLAQQVTLVAIPEKLALDFPCKVRASSGSRFDAGAFSGV